MAASSIPPRDQVAKQIVSRIPDKATVAQIDLRGLDAVPQEFTADVCNVDGVLSQLLQWEARSQLSPAGSSAIR